ncbi:serine/threonine protein phosphatase 2A 55 kDa regulatory subunit B alpha isoform-like isoform X5 [Mangifera indica]|uniref:serine/threonine protein phosphatase 2A 55 kDa regulatory subunit B alpha isoform-like isoform X5 n=1 Tax=Mangifera indica TaxID=29780 RepID=UPI001CFC277E|nr:serine/threonine protein phosphatase 2A 55 kDa regulatory subunit B alpha isoform-like isoform X5 [Mangifera indica]
MVLKREDASTPLEWKFSQVFGERSPDEEVQDVDIISAIEFDKTGDYLAVGDRGGRVIIFETDIGKDTPSQQFSINEMEQMDSSQTMHIQYQYKTEFQSHEPEFDYLKSLEIEEKINRLRWCATTNGSLFILSTNDKTIKLWKVYAPRQKTIKDRKVKKVKEMDPSPYVYSENTLLAEMSFMSKQNTQSVPNGYLQWTENMDKNMSPSQEVHTKIANTGDSAHTRCQKVFGRAHDFNINSISNNSDGETFISADDLRINLWNLEISGQCFNIVEMKPSNMDDLTEVITSAQFHPIQCNLLAYSSSRGFIRLVDMRQSALCDNSARICGICVWILHQLQHSRFMSTYAPSYVSCIMMTPYLINLNAVSVEMDYILQLDPIAIFCVSSPVVLEVQKGSQLKLAKVETEEKKGSYKSGVTNNDNNLSFNFMFPD